MTDPPQTPAGRRRAVVNLRETRPIWALPDWALAEIRAAFPADWEVRVVEGGTDGSGDGGRIPPDAIEAVAGAEAYFGYGFPRPLFDAGRDSLRWVHSGSAGVAGALYPEMRDSAILLTNSAGIHAEPIADTVLAMMLHFARGLDLAVRAQAARRWGKDEFEAADAPLREAAGARVGVVGFGGIGRAVGRRAAALGMEVLAWKRTPAEVPEGTRLLLGDDGLRELLAESHYVVLTVPQTPETRGLIGARELERMRADAVLINVARGGVVDEDALVDALRRRRIRGAGLDVFRQEPLPPDSPLWELPNALLTPHVSGTSRGYWRRETDLIVENVRRYLAGKPLRNQVDKHAGY